MMIFELYECVMMLTTEELIENFALFDDWEERYRYLIDLGRDIPKMDETDRGAEFLVKGCTSQVWLHADKKGDHYIFRADSDAHIVRGLIALLLVAYNNKTAAEIADVNIENFFAQLGLQEHLSPNRRNGFFAMVEKIKRYSAA